MRRSRLTIAAATLVSAAFALSACSGPAPAASSGAPATSAAAAPVTLTFRTWDENAAAAYKQSFEAFTAANPDIKVTTEVVPWSDYFTKLRTDIAGGSAADLFWLNNSSYLGYAQSGALVDVGSVFGGDPMSLKQTFAPAVVDQFTDGGKLWGVPQTSDGGIAVYYNKKLLDAAGVKPADIAKLTWSPSGGDDTLLKFAQKLTKDKAGKTADQAGFDGKNVVQYGYNAAQDLQAIYLNFIGSNGGTYQNPDGTFTLDNPKTVEAFGYIVDLINKYHVAPSAADTNTNGNFSLDAFNQGKMALFQSGLYNLSNVANNASFEWGVVGLPAGPAGAVSVTNGVSVMGNAKSAHPDAVAKVLKWLGSADGNKQIGATGANLPGVLAAQQVYLDYWAGKKVDLTPFFDVIKNATPIPAPVGANFAAGYTAAGTILNDVFLGRTPVADGLKKANDAANAAIAG